jgi:hypothetical protein
MPPSSERCLESAGKVALGMETSTIGFQPQAEQATPGPVPPI